MTRSVRVWLALFLMVVASAGSCDPAAAKAGDGEPVKLDFDDVLVRTLNRNPSSMDMRGVVGGRRRRATPRPSRRQDLGAEMSADLEALGGLL